MVLSLFHTYCHHSYRKKIKQMVINNLPAISHVFETSVSIRNKPLGLIEKNLTRVIREIFCSSMVAVA